MSTAATALLSYRVFGDVGGSGAASHVTAGAVLTLVLPLGLLVIVLAWWWLAARRGWPPLPTTKRPPTARHHGHLRHRDE
jgi:hypothetical protein